jgi:hypothetical protein
LAGYESLKAATLRVMSEVVRAKMNCNGEPRILEMPGMWNVYQGKPQTTSQISPEERPCDFQLIKPSEQGCPNPLETISCYHMLQMLDVKL